MIHHCPMMVLRHLPLYLLLCLMLCGCLHMTEHNAVPVATYDKVARSFLMLTREDEKDGKTIWSQGSGVAVKNETGRHFIYTARHILFDKDNDNATPARLYATLMTGESREIDISKFEIPRDNHDAVRIILEKPICDELQLSDRVPRFGERLSFFGDAAGTGVMNVESGTVVAIGPLEFEHTADIVRGMSGGPVVDSKCNVIGLCEKGRKMSAHKNGIELKDESKYLQIRKFEVVLSNIEWQVQTDK